MATNRSLLTIGLLLLAAAAAGCGAEQARPTPIPSPLPSPTPTLAPPTPAPAGSPILYQGLVVNMQRAEFSSGYTSRYGSPRTPASGRKFAWVYLKLSSAATDEITLPLASRFSLLYLEDEYKPDYGNPPGFQDLYDLTGARLAPGAAVDSGLRFEVPENARLELLTLAFMPEGRNVSLPAASAGQDWARRPLYLWHLAAAVP